MIEIKDIENRPVNRPDITHIIHGDGNCHVANNARPPVITISGDMSVVDIFNVIVNSEIMDSKEMYELGSYFRTFADFHTPVEPADKMAVPYRGF